MILCDKWSSKLNPPLLFTLFSIKIGPLKSLFPFYNKWACLTQEVIIWYDMKEWCSKLPPPHWKLGLFNTVNLYGIMWQMVL